MRSEARESVTVKRAAAKSATGARSEHPGPDLHLRKLTDTLKENLTKCADNPAVDPVHDTRTGTRRIEAALEAALRKAGAQPDEDDELAKAVRGWERLLKTIRRAAAPVRDLDVQRKLLKTLVPAVEGELKVPANEAELGMAAQVDKLDNALKDERDERAAPLKKNAAKWAAKLDGHFEKVAVPRSSTRNASKTHAAKTALDAFARLANTMRQLDAGNLHDFRKEAKKARYMAEAGGDDERAGAVGKALKKLQDEIGEWHDWLMLAEEAHKYLDEGGARITAEIERMRDLHFAMAIKTEVKMRGRLMGEWLADASPRRRPRGTSRPDTPASHPDNPEAQKSLESA